MGRNLLHAKKGSEELGVVTVGELKPSIAGKKVFSAEFEYKACSEELGVVTVGELKPSIAGKRSFRPSSSTRHVTEWPISDVSSDLTIEVGTASFALHKFPLVSQSGRIRKLLVILSVGRIRKLLLEEYEIYGSASCWSGSSQDRNMRSPFESLYIQPSFESISCEGSGSKAESMIKSSEELGVVTVGELKPSIAGKRSFRPSSSTRHVTEWPISDVSSDLTIEVGTASFALHKDSFAVPSSFSEWKNTKTVVRSKRFNSVAYKSVSCTGWTRGI
ncbi:hypothetical protein TEA_003998 [Camellia sinensis var. sinensis]|uniref:Uncharacterized protein n=1 Tax=Camellia sinensis var. sinensis TaxID=542762 RepID=A0A4S4DD06_CAMSN|nr:hypothetical protein TEA_003998 [Camellia sinensis var. sinensis]